ncbi:MAG: S8 family serine peptidase, partial [Ideonella sp.]|nr:S8 family serine peptidase [Ideonella sp.]
MTLCPPNGLRGLLCRWIAAMLVSVPLAASAQSADDTPLHKLTRDLRELIDARPHASATSPWQRLTGGGLLVKVIVTVDPSARTGLADLVGTVLALGGSVTGAYPSIGALSVLLPAPRLLALTRLPIVTGVSPNRPVVSTRSLVERSTGAAEPMLQSGLGYDGKGVGIAVLDSGIAWQHRHFMRAGPLGLAPQSRVRQAVNLRALVGTLGDGGWQLGLDSSARTVQADVVKLLGTVLQTSQRWTNADAHGHGTHVASIAAGDGGYQMPDTTGIAPGADLYDVRVLDDNGVGTTADVLAGMEWVIQRAKLLNIRVVNLSLAADSTESHLTNPLARAARAAVHAGLVVVVAGGNHGLSEDGREAYGTIGSPGDEPSVITVGAANVRGTAERSDDSVTRFSSRGPTRGRTTVDGRPWIDN